MVAVRVVVEVLLFSPIRRVAGVLSALVDGEGRDADAGQTEMVGTVVVPGHGVRIRLQGQAKLLRRCLHLRIEGGAIGASELHRYGIADRQQHVIVEIERDLRCRNGWMESKIFRAKQSLLFGCNGRKDDAVGRRNRSVREGVDKFEENSAA